MPPLSCTFAFGLYDGAWLVGVAVFSNPVQPKVLTNVYPDLVPYYESTELGRLVLAESVHSARRAGSWRVAGSPPPARTSAAS